MAGKARKAGKRTASDVLVIYITPPANTFPWLKIFQCPNGVRGAKREVPGVSTPETRAKAAAMIGEAIIESSGILKKWCT